MYSNQEPADTLFMHGLADGNAVVVRQFYQEKYSDVQIGKYL
jgi:hypothetical protein